MSACDVMRLPAHTGVQQQQHLPVCLPHKAQDYSTEALSPVQQAEVLVLMRQLAAGKKDRAAIAACSNPALPLADVIAFVMKQCASSGRSQQDLSVGCTVAQAVCVLATDGKAVALLLKRPEPVLRDGVAHSQPTAMEALLAAAVHAARHQPVRAEAAPFVQSCLAAIAAVATAAPKQFVESPPAAASTIMYVLGQGLCCANDAAVVRAAARAAACLARCPAAARYLSGVRLLAGVMDVLGGDDEDAAAAASAALVILTAARPGACAVQPYFIPELLAAVRNSKSEYSSSADLLPELLTVVRSLTLDASSATPLAATPGLVRLLTEVLRSRRDDAGIVQLTLVILYALTCQGSALERAAVTWLPAVDEVGPLSAVMSAAAYAADKACALGGPDSRQHERIMLLVGAVASWLLHRAPWPSKKLRREVDASVRGHAMLWGCVKMYVWGNHDANPPQSMMDATGSRCLYTQI